MSDQETTWEIISPCDEVTLQGEFVPCAVATLLLGEGQLGLDEVEGDRSFPILLFAGDETMDRIRDALGIDLKEYLADHKPEIIAALRTAVAGKRDSYELAVGHIEPGNLDAFTAEWNDRNTGSLNDIAGGCIQLADSMERRMTEDQETQAAGDPAEGGVNEHE